MTILDFITHPVFVITLCTITVLLYAWDIFTYRHEILPEQEAAVSQEETDRDTQQQMLDTTRFLNREHSAEERAIIALAYAHAKGYDDTAAYAAYHRVFRLPEQRVQALHTYQQLRALYTDPNHEQQWQQLLEAVEAYRDLHNTVE